MEPFVPLLLVLGLVVLVKGADVLVAGASRLAKALGVSPLIIGLTIVALGTSAPELAISSLASLGDRPAVALGNVVGSNIANIGLVLGLAAVLYPLRVKRAGLRFQALFLLLASSMLVLASLDGMVSALDAGLFLALFAVFLGHLVRLAKRQHRLALAAEAVERKAGRLVKAIGDRGEVAKGLVVALAGLAAVVWGAGLFLDSSISLARAFGVTERVIGLTLIAIGTSLPELVTSVMAALRRQHELAIGNIVGSNVFNILFVLGVAGLLAPLAVPGALLMDMAIALLFALAVLVFSGERGIGRVRGAFLLVAYGVYVAWLLVA